MARIVAFTPDLLFGSRVQAELLAAGHEVELIGDPQAVAGALRDAQLLVVDLTDESYGGLALAGQVPTLAFYSHVDVEMRARAQDAGFDTIVPRSRMAREGPALVEGLLESA